jgi:hypothetical protein
MTFSKLWLALVLCVSTSAMAESVTELKQKIQKLEAQIESGTDPALVQPYIDKFKTQLSELEAQSQAKTPKAPSSAKVAVAKPVSGRAPKRRLNKRESQLEFLKTTNVEDRLDRYSVLSGLIKSGKLKLHSIRNSGKSWQQIKKEVTTHQDQIVEWQREFDLLAESLGPLRAIASSPVEKAPAEESVVNPKSSAPMMGGKLKFSGHMQYRLENQNETAYPQAAAAAAKEGLSLFRLRGNFLYTANEKLTVGFTPQAVKVLGGQEYVGTGGGAAVQENTATNSSGSTYNPQVDYFEAYAEYKVTENLSAKLGRQELAYGDHLIIGSLPWANDGRSFDALKLRYTHGQSKTDLFASQISNASTSADALDDTTFYGLYTQLGEVVIFKEFDLYALSQTVPSVNTELNTFGFRFKGLAGGFFYRMESGLQQGTLVGARIEDGYQVDSDLGFVAKTFDIKVGYSQAGIQYIQLYPTAHKFLGFADIFGRRNIVSYRATATWKSDFGLSAHLFYHNFQRRDVNVVPYNLVNAAYTNAAASDASDLGSEVDLVIKQKFLKTSQVHLGAAIFTPGEFFKDQADDDASETRNFFYVQVISKF